MLGTAEFSTGGEAGVENNGLATGCRGSGCRRVNVTTLEKYVAEHVDGGRDTQGDQRQPIHVLQIDVEGYDGDAIIGAGPGVMGRVEYLEFEYNWMGSWAGQHLFDLIKMLDERDGFTCYWAGEARLWRITGCWMQYYDVHTWSNVACANRRRVPGLASKMEAVFRRTLLEKGRSKEDGTNTTMAGHDILRTDALLMTSRYLSH